MIFFFVSGFPKTGNRYFNNEALVILTGALYEQLHLSEIGLKKDIFEKAMNGWNQMFEGGELSKSHLLSIMDLSQSANLKRLYIIDVEKGVLLYNTLVAHGRNSGEEFAKSFSNNSNSKKTSLGFYQTGKTYDGKNGLSLQLIGLEKGINNYAERRSIVIHGAKYVSDVFIKSNGHLGRSQGCPAISKELCEPIISVIKEGSCFFIYYPDTHYLKTSEFLKPTP